MSKMSTAVPDVPVSRRAAKKSRIASARRRTARAGIVALIVAGGLVTTFAVVWAVQPAIVEELASKITSPAGHTPVTTVAGDDEKTPAPVASTVPGSTTVTLGVAGGDDVLDRCDGTFTHMVAYGDILPPVWAAHNDCGGDVILPWEKGQKVTVAVDGKPTEFVIVDTRDTRKEGSTTADIAGMTGDLLLQTCYYGADRMKFLGLESVAS